MAERAKSDDIDRRKLTRFAMQTLGSRRTAFFMSHSEFAKESANLASELYLSRQDSDYVCRVPCDEIIEQSEVIWAATLLSHMCQSDSLTYDDVCDLTNPAVAGYLHWVLPDKSISLFEGTARILSQLAQVNNYYECGPIFTVLAKAIVSVEGIGDNPSVAGLMDKNVITSFATSLWSIAHTLKQLKVACVYRWSEYVHDRMKAALDTVTKWENNGECPMLQFKCGDSSHRVDWRLNMEVNPKPKDFVEYVEM